MRDHDRKLYAASLTDAYVRRRIDRRTFLRRAGQLGLGLGAFGLGVTRPFGGHFKPVAHAQDLRPDPEVLAWVKEVSTPFRGATLKFATESTPPSNALNSQLKQYFEEASGIKVEIEVLPLEQVLQKMTLDIASQLGSYDLYYIDQSWAAFTSQDVFDPREQYAARPDLAMPNWNIDDFMPALVDGIAVYGDTWVGVPYDIPIFIMMYRKDIYDQMGFSAPKTFEEYLNQARAITETMGPDMYGATGQMRSGHYSLECDWTAWLWGHGGSIFRPDRTFSGNDEYGLEAMAYWRELFKTMPPGVTTWTWDGQGQSIAQGVAATMMSWGEFFPYFDDPSATRVSGLMEAVRCPAPVRALRTVDETAFGEIPGVGHQGGSTIAVSRNAKNPDAAWIFMQWATSFDTQVLITTLGGGTGPTRTSVYEDPRVLANNRVGPGTTRHLQVVKETIENDMGSEPDLPEWAELSNDTIPVRLGRYFADEYPSAKAAMDDIAQAVDAIVRA
ncbi:MAG: ABC transporter substrate-binding protein [Rubrimonas sp.]